jgi:hypothetical protein
MKHHEHLDQADRLIADCLNRIARQREVIATEYEAGLATHVAESMLRELEESLRALEKHRQFVVDQEKRRTDNDWQELDHDLRSES